MQEVNQLSCLLDEQVIQGESKHNVLVSLANNFTGFFSIPLKMTETINWLSKYLSINFLSIN